MFVLLGAPSFRTGKQKKEEKKPEKVLITSLQQKPPKRGGGRHFLADGTTIYKCIKTIDIIKIITYLQGGGHISLLTPPPQKLHMIFFMYLYKEDYLSINHES